MMEQNERDAQRAVGNMEEYRVTMEIPIKIVVHMLVDVQEVNKGDEI